MSFYMNKMFGLFPHFNSTSLLQFTYVYSVKTIFYIIYNDSRILGLGVSVCLCVFLCMCASVCVCVCVWCYNVKAIFASGLRELWFAKGIGQDTNDKISLQNRISKQLINNIIGIIQALFSCVLTKWSTTELA